MVQETYTQPCLFFTFFSDEKVNSEVIFLQWKDDHIKLLDLSVKSKNLI